MPRTSARVVCTLRDTIVTFEPTNALVSGQGLRLVPPGDRYLARFSVSVVSL